MISSMTLGLSVILSGLGVDIWTWHHDTCRIRKSGDTLFVSTKTQPQLFHLYPSGDEIKIISASHLSSITFYSYNTKFDSRTIERMARMERHCPTKANC